MALIERRTGLLFALFLCVMFAVLLRAGQLTVLQGGTLRARAAAQQVATVPLPAPRGTIRDRHGRELAVSTDAADISATPYLVERPTAVAARLAPLLGLDRREIVARLADRERGFVYLKRGVSGTRAAAIKKLNLKGIDQVPVTRRKYPQRLLAAQALGFVGTDGKGLAGLELSYDRSLRGVSGERRIVKDAVGRPISFSLPNRLRPGTDLTLTIDGAIQLRAESVLAQIGTEFKPKGATAIVMDPRTGEILALADWPRIDANRPDRAPPEALRERAIGVGYEPGSTFKAFTVAGALEQRLVTPETTFDLPPQLQVADRVIKESHPRGAVRLSVRQILEQSSNVGAVKVGMELGPRRFDGWVRKFGFGSPTGVDLPGEERGLVPGYEDYSGSSIGNLPIGQGLSVTAMQMVAAYSAIANGGVLRKPRLVRAVGGRTLRPSRGRRVISSRTSRDLRDMLKGVLGPGGTASEAAIPGYKLAGKTGTAQKPDPGGGYSKTRYVASFIGFAPADRPRLLVAVMVDEPRGEYYGGLVAAPAFQRIVAFGLPYLRIPPQ